MRSSLVQGIVGLALVCQPAAAGPSFEVASVKPAAAQKGPGIRVSISQDKGRVTMTNVTLKMLLSQAYKVKEHQLVTPDWMDSERFDIVAKLPEGGTKEQVPEMMQMLLQERFKMAIHEEPKVLSVYGLVLAKGGPKLHSTETQGGLRMMMSPRGRQMSGVTSMGQLADTLSNTLDRPVIDMTELKGNYEIDLTWSPDETDRMGGKMSMMGRGPGRGPEGGDENHLDTSDAPTLFIALQEKLGLKLEARKAPAKIIVVDNAEKVPTEN